MLQWAVQPSSTSWRTPSRKASAQRAHSLEDQENFSPGPCPAPSFFHENPKPALLPVVQAQHLGQHRYLGRAGRIQHPQPKLAHASLGLCPDAGASPDRRQGRMALPSGVTWGAAFQVGTVLTNGPFVLSFPCQGAALFSPEKGTMGHCAQQKGAPCLASSLLGSGSLFGFARSGRGHQRGLPGAHALMFPPGSSFLGPDQRGPVHLREWTPLTGLGWRMGSVLAHSA